VAVESLGTLLLTTSAPKKEHAHATRPVVFSSFVSVHLLTVIAMSRIANQQDVEQGFDGKCWDILSSFCFNDYNF
jgi:hypothetical protein